MSDDLGTSESSSSSGGDETDLLTGRGESGSGGGFSDVLVVSSSVGMVDGVHLDSGDSGPDVSSSLVFEVGSSGLEDGLVGSASSGDEADHGSAVTRKGLSGS